MTTTTLACPFSTANTSPSRPSRTRSAVADSELGATSTDPWPKPVSTTASSKNWCWPMNLNDGALEPAGAPRRIADHPVVYYTL